MNTLSKENSKIIVEMWVDFMCPLCYIAKTNIESAVNEFVHKEDVQMRIHPFQLFPDAPLNKERNYYEYTSLTHNGISVDYIKENNRSVVELAQTIGLNYDLDNLIPTNTTDALRLTLYAQEKGKARELSAKIYKAYFEEGQNIADAETLIALGVEAGLVADEISNILNSDAYEKEMRDSRLMGKKIGVRGVPFFNLNSKYGISGLRSKGDLLSALNQVWAEENREISLKIIEGKSCDFDGKCQ